ncbi:restriction endonuclease subunit S [Vibrio fluvialis]|uniref:restriction endonuclease subunit S n=1 Tax=Vibrio fluvialis TaxID=676 RepID=UPI003D0E94D1
MSQYKAYPAYKDSGVEWIGQVPEEWKTGKLKHLGTLKGGSGFPTDMQGQPDNELPFYKVGDLSKSRDNLSLNGSSNTISRKDAKELGATVFPENTISWAKIGAALFLNRRRISKTACCLDNNMTGFVVDSKKVPIQYAFYLMNAIDFSFFARPGAVPSLSEGEQSAIPIAIPSYEESFSIAATLDRETARIDALIQKKTRFIELLKEKRQALITHAVTKGLDPNVKMKDSGVEWIGQVPEHWKIAPVKYHYDARLGKMIQPAAVSDRDIEVPYHRAQTVQWERIVESDIKEMWASPRDIEQFSVSEGDLLICEGGDVCRAAIVKQPPEKNMIFQNSIHRIRSKGEYGVGWVMRLMQHLRSSEWIDVLCNKNTIVHFTSDKLGSLECPLPPPDEQATIAAALDRETARIDALIGKAEHSITLLKERRSAFITAAVTGQIDLRGEQ